MLLCAQNLVKSYDGFLALKGLDLSIERGDVYCLLGANGAGKTTTIQLFLGFIEPTSGSAQIDGLEVKLHPIETKRLLAYIPENVMLYPNLTGLENLRYFSTLAGVEACSDDEMRDTLKRAGLPEAAINRRVGTYSKGMRQKVGIAMAIARRVQLLLLDEPTSGLDPKASNEFSELVMSLSSDGVGVLMATHDLFRAREIATRIGIMKQGVLVTEFDASDVTHQQLEQVYLEHMQDAAV
jgi:ABC-2 type transport system ATP-binding protein